MLRMLSSMGPTVRLADFEAWLPTTQGKPAWFAEAKRDRAADLGTITHARIEAWLQGTSLDPDGIPPALYEQSVHGQNRFAEWWYAHGFKWVASEQKLISEKLQVGGTADIAATTRDGINALIDIKTSKASAYWPYAENIAQAATYAEMLADTTGINVQQVWLVRVGKEAGDTVETVCLTDSQRAAGRMLFDGALRCYQALRLLDRD
jgi:hypothetical protein